MQRGRRQPAAANGDGNADMHRARRLEFAVAVKAVEGGKAARGQRHRSDHERADQQAAVGRPRGIDTGQPLLAGGDVDLMLEIIMRDFPLRSRHGGGDGRSHGVEIEPGCALLFRLSDGRAETALDVGMDDRPRRTASGHRREIDRMQPGEPPRGR
jgi:hypothetical protein